MSDKKPGKTNIHWRYSAPKQSIVDQLVSGMDVSPVVASLLCRAGVTEVEAANRFLHPRLAHLDNPFRITNLDKAVDRLIRAMRDGERIGIVGDYDVDGVTSTVLLVSILRLFGVFPKYLVPRRLEEGYGLSAAALERLIADEEPELLVALDCGTNSVEEVAGLRAKGIDVVIIDHHQSKDAIPSDCILVNPHVNDGEDEPWRNLCTVGLVFKVVHGLTKRLRDEEDETALELKLKDYLDLVALGTIADLVPLTGENRIFTRFGLHRLQQTPRPGIRALLDVAGLSPDQDLTTPDVSFRIGPRINASGRMADAAVPVELLLGDDYGSCILAARELDAANRERQGIERAIFQEALEQAKGFSADSSGIVVYGSEWHPGVVGIVAGRLAREFRRPAIVLGSEGSLAKGSGRSIAGICLQRILTDCDRILGSWGGHSMAVGVSLDVEKLESFRAAFSEAVESYVGDGGFPDLEIDIAAWIESNEVGDELLGQLDLLHPFGQENPTPVFALSSIKLAEPPTCFGQNHCRFKIHGARGQRIFVVGWNSAENLPPVDQPIDLALRLMWNYWNGSRSPRAEVVAWRPVA
ncbi:single-stranded-DNA-specific exonuclease RecJ [Rubellicoccus peritrichatus]|uniref:Single-stranded-DNA-specific exonuclease RecJ n=1 Tax=Rubellicoccus peritrichatus TaxID=3080537 RepID=A0AAQ3L6V4_9BACT|nr:single-stranded-DNA-specific exonuclease RecJ [Puniceicoccus sp. CR14]WOO40101.1 single-stranded-DNA-specific exonuclease RecJ [Puniceicoccus sp. CR14]